MSSAADGTASGDAAEGDDATRSGVVLLVLIGTPVWIWKCLMFKLPGVKQQIKSKWTTHVRREARNRVYTPRATKNPLQAGREML